MLYEVRSDGKRNQVSTAPADVWSGNRGSKVSVAVVGCGQWGKNLVRNFAELGALHSVWDRDPEARARAVESTGVPAVAWEDILADPATDGVVLATPAATHAHLAMEALEVGKHVLVEKPLALDLEGAEAVTHLAEARGLVLMVGHLLRYHPAFLRLKEIVDAGELGRIQYIYSNRLNFGRFRREENILWSFAPHDLSMILSLVGTEPSRVEAVGSRYLHTQLADVTTTHLFFPGGEAAHVFVSWLHPYKEQRLVVVGERGMAVFDDGEPWPSKLRLYRHEVAWRGGLPQPAKADSEPVPLEEDQPLRLECQHFLDCIAQGRTPLTDGREGIRVLRVLDAAERSMREGEGAALAMPDSENMGVHIHPSAVVDPGVRIGAGTKVWHFSHLLSGTVVGESCVIGQNVMIGPEVSVGDRCKIQNNVSLYKGVVLEDDVFCGPSAVFTNVVTPRAHVERKEQFLPTVIRTGATIGANATIICGHEVGAYSMVGAGAVVTADVPPHALVVGVPARRVGWVSHAGERLGPDLVCPASGRTYRETDDGQLEECLTDSEDHRGT